MFEKIACFPKGYFNRNSEVEVHIYEKFLFGILCRLFPYGCGTTTTNVHSVKATRMPFSSERQVAGTHVGCQTSSTQCLNGEGVYIYPDGTRYEGHFEGGKKQGSGVLKFADGRYYDGDFHNGKRHGYGEGSFTSNGGYRYDGEWKDDKPDGRGNQIMDNGEQYKGEFQQGKRQGRGEYRWPSGNRHVGEWQNGKRHGRGVHVFADGAAYIGGWKYDQIVHKGKKAKSDYASMLEAFFRRETGINPYNEEEFHRMLEAFLKRRSHSRSGDEINKELGKVVEDILRREGYLPE